MKRKHQWCWEHHSLIRVEHFDRNLFDFFSQFSNSLFLLLILLLLYLNLLHLTLIKFLILLKLFSPSDLILLDSHQLVQFIKFSDDKQILLNFDIKSILLLILLVLGLTSFQHVLNATVLHLQRSVLLLLLLNVLLHFGQLLLRDVQVLQIGIIRNLIL